jgi:hypothetical protein
MIIMTIILVLDINVDSDCDDENVALNSECKDKSVKLFWYNNVWICQ